MALPSSGTLSIQDIVDEFGGTAPHSLSEYYRNGAYVGSNNTGVPTSGTISLSDFYGATAATVVTVTEGSRTWDNGGVNVPHYGYGAANKGWRTNQSNFATMSAFGSRSPTTLYGATIQGIYYEDTNSPSSGYWDFIIVLSGTRAQNFFTSANVQGGSTLLTANADGFYQNSGSTIWWWNISNTSDLWPTWNGSGTRTVTFI